MSEAPRKILYLVIEGLPKSQWPPAGDDAEVFTLTEANAREALEKIFAADAVSVWGDVTT
jgi:hypothetical protein